MIKKNRIQQGFSLIELMIAMTIGLVIVIAATLIYLTTAKNQRALERKSAGQENGAFVMHMLGREIMNAGFYPANFPPVVSDTTQAGMYDTYPPLESSPRKNTDWQNVAANWPPASYMTGIYGCEGGEFNVSTGGCPATSATAPDSIVINYFTNDAMAEGGMARDCTGSKISNDPSNSYRKNAANNENTPPLLPMFVSNRFTVRQLNNFVDQNSVSTHSLSCSGNGMNPHGTVSSYQPIIAGIKDIQFKYGVYKADSNLMPERLYTAAEVSALPTIQILGQNFTGWQRVTSVRVCVLSQSQGGGVRLTDEAGKEMTYQDCDDSAVQQPAGQWVERFVQTFGVRNGLKQSY